MDTVQITGGASVLGLFSVVTSRLTRAGDPLPGKGRIRADSEGLTARPTRWIQRLRPGVVLLLVGGALLLTSARGSRDFDSQLNAVAGSRGFDLFTWEVRTLSTRVVGAVFHPAAVGQIDRVREYTTLTAAASRARADRDAAWAREAVNGPNGDAAAAQDRLTSLEGQLNTLRPDVEATLSAQIEDELRRQSIRTGLLTFATFGQPPFVRPSLTPGVFFQLGVLPDLLVVAPTDQIQIISSVLVAPGLSISQVDQLEKNADSLGVSSVVTGIGGLAAYPSMLPDSQSVHDLLITVSHEWTHHYLALHPLGMAYFSGYQMREINETVADMVGREVGQNVYDRTYRPGEPSVPPPANPASAPAVAPTHPDFWTLMRQTRVAVEGYLATHDVKGANAYMVEQRQELARQGYYVRKLNTAYLSFFGSYSGGANPYELKLRQIRANSPSLAAFLTTVADVRNPSDLDRILAER